MTLSNTKAQSINDEARATIEAAFAALNDLRVINCALHSASDPCGTATPIDETTRQTVLQHSIALMQERLDLLDNALDSLEDLIAAASRE